MYSGAGYIWARGKATARWGRWQGVSLLVSCLFAWFLIAALAAPYLQAWLNTPDAILGLILAYILWVAPWVWRWWCPSGELAVERQRLWGVLRANWERVLTLLGLIVVVMICVRMGAETWAGRLSAFPLLPLYTLVMLGASESVGRQDSTVLLGPVIAMLFVWGFVRYLGMLAQGTAGAVYLGGAVLGLLVGWSLGGGLIWGMLRVAAMVETGSTKGTKGHEEKKVPRGAPRSAKRGVKKEGGDAGCGRI